MAIERLIERLAEATGTPPGEGAAPETVLDATALMLERRARILEEIATCGPADPGLRFHPSWVELEAREASWTAAIDTARAEVVRRMEGLGRPKRPAAPESIGPRRKA